jgi:hypothetical protein
VVNDVGVRLDVVDGKHRQHAGALTLRVVRDDAHWQVVVAALDDEHTRLEAVRYDGGGRLRVDVPDHDLDREELRQRCEVDQSATIVGGQHAQLVLFNRVGHSLGIRLLRFRLRLVPARALQLREELFWLRLDLSKTRASTKKHQKSTPRTISNARARCSLATRMEISVSRSKPTATA